MRWAVSDLPENWTTALIGDVIDFSPKNNVPDNTEVGFVPLHLMGKRYLDKHGFEKKRWSEIKKGYTHFADGDVLLARITPSFENGKGGIVQGLPNGIGAGSTEYFVCRPRKELLHPKYLLALFKTYNFLQDGARVMQGAVGQQRVPKQYVLEHEIPLPPLNEQKRIAEKLDTLLARVDSCQTHLERVPQILKRFRQSVLAAATSGRLLDAENSGVENFLPLSEVIEKVKTGPFGSTLHKSDYISNGVPLVNPTHINNGRITPSSEVTITEKMAKHLQEFRLTRGDVIIARRGIMGRCAVVGEKEEGWLCGSGSMMLHPTEKVLPEYLQMFLSSPETVANLDADSVGSTMSNLNQKILLNLIIHVPTVEEQTEIVRRVEKLFAYAERLEARYTSASEHVERLTPSLLAKAFRGELVRQE
jgi:type I restriction enzyme S subunit